MQTVLPLEFKRSMVVMLDNSPHVIEELRVSGTAQTKHKLHCRLRNLKSGRFIDRTFGDNERVPVAALEHRTVQFSYKVRETYVFLDTKSYDELELPVEQVGERHWFLKENEDYKALLLDGKLIDIVLPQHSPLRVVETAAPVRGGSDSAWKEAKLETGLQVMVPLFIASGDMIRVDTHDRKYAGKSD